MHGTLTAGKSQDVGLPGESHEHSSNCNARQRAVETPESKVDVLEWRRNTESYEVRQVRSELGTKGRTLWKEARGGGSYSHWSLGSRALKKVWGMEDS